MASPSNVRFAREPLSDALWAEAFPLLNEHWREIAHFQDIELDPDVAVYQASEAAGILRVYTARQGDGQFAGMRATVDDVQPDGTATVTCLGAFQKRGVPLDHITLPPLVGYAIFFVRPNPHYKGSVQAAQDVLYLAPAVRGGTGFKFIRWCDEQLRAEGVQAVYHHVKQAHNFGPLLERQGYQLVDLIYAKRLDAVAPVYQGFDPASWESSTVDLRDVHAHMPIGEDR